MSEPIEIPTSRLSAAEFLTWVDAQPAGRFELLDGQVVPMAPESVAHAHAKMMCWLALRNAIRAAALPCEAIGDGVAVRVDEATVYEPDVSVVCGERPSANDVLVPSPVILVEVTSPSNSRVDLVTKLADYVRLPSLRHYLVVHLAKRVVIHHRRDEAGGIATRILGSGALTLDPPGITVAVEQLFEE